LINIASRHSHTYTTTHWLLPISFPQLSLAVSVLISHAHRFTGSVLENTTSPLYEGQHRLFFFFFFFLQQAVASHLWKHTHRKRER